MSPSALQPTITPSQELSSGGGALLVSTLWFPERSARSGLGMAPCSHRNVLRHAPARWWPVSLCAGSQPSLSSERGQDAPWACLHGNRAVPHKNKTNEQANLYGAKTDNSSGPCIHQSLPITGPPTAPVSSQKI